MFARGRAVVSAWWVGRWCRSIPSSSSWADCDRELHANTHAAGKRCLLGTVSDLHHSTCLALCLSLIPPPICKRQCLGCQGLLLDWGTWCKSCCGWEGSTSSAGITRMSQRSWGAQCVFEQPGGFGTSVLGVPIHVPAVQWGRVAVSCWKSHASVLVSRQQEVFPGPAGILDLDSFCQPGG